MKFEKDCFREIVEKNSEHFPQPGSKSSQTGNDFSEEDTIRLLVEPVLALAGWDIWDWKQVRRPRRNSVDPEPDISLYVSDQEDPVAVIEVKTPESGEFNIDKDSCGCLTKKTGNT
ncbi:MAG: hypothetical protein ABIM21_01325 [candidate division WOR-3 bacterium]